MKRYSLVTVDSKGRPAVHPQELGQIIGDSLGSNEDKDLAVLLRDLFQVAEKLASLVKVSADFDMLGNIVVGSKVKRTNVNLDKVVEEVHGETLDLLGPSGREQKGLSVRSDLRNNLSNLRLETHVEHSVGFVHNEISNALEVGLSGLEHVDQSTRSGDTDLDTSLEVSDLRALGSTTVNGSVPNSGRLTKLGSFSLNLNSKLSGRSKDKNDRAVTGGEKRLGIDVDHRGKTERNSLTRTSLGNGDNVTTGQSHRPSLALDRRRSSETHSSDLGHDVVGEAGLLKGSDGSRNVLALDLVISSACFAIL